MASSATDLQTAQAEFNALLAERSRRTLLGFTTYVNSEYKPNWHHARLAYELDQVLAGKTNRLIVNMPPQHGKTELVSRMLPAYALGRNPDMRVIHGSYNTEYARDISSDVQRIMSTPEYGVLFPFTKLSQAGDREKRLQDEFDVVGRKGGYLAAGVGGGITGRSMHLGIIDDPVKSREEAESDAYRKKTWNWYVNDFRTRRIGDFVPIVLVQTRWHEDDLAGRLIAQAKENPAAEQWKVVSFPAICDQLRVDDPRKLDEALWPTRFSRADLETTKATSGIYDWSALFQQTPVPAGGAMGNRLWFPVKPYSGPIVRRLRAWDLAATKAEPGRDPDWTVGVRLAQLYSGLWMVEHVVRVRDTPGKIDQLMVSTAYADGRHVSVREWQDPGAAGKSVVASHLRLLAGFDYEAVPASGEKTMQWRPFLVQAEGGNIFLAPGVWNNDFIDEMSTLPYGKHDDQADGMALAFNSLALVKAPEPAVAVIMSGTSTASGPGRTDWQSEYFRR